MSNHVVYGLVDPRDGEYRYVGLSTRGLARPRSHLGRVNDNDHTYRANWLRTLNANNLKPIIVVLQECVDEDELAYAEDYWIRLLRIEGQRLTNHLSGGFVGRKPDEATRAKLSTALRGRTCSPEAIQHMSEAKRGKKNPMFGRPVSRATRDKRAESLSGEKNHRFGMAPPPESAATRFRPGHPTWNKGLTLPELSGPNHPRFGRKHSAESVQKMSNSKLGSTPWNKGKRATNEARANLSAARIGTRMRCSVCGELGHNRQTCGRERT